MNRIQEHRPMARPLTPDWRPMVETALGVMVGGLGLMVVWYALQLAERMR